MTTWVYDKRFVPFLWPHLHPTQPEHLTHDHPCLVVLTTGRVPQYPFVPDEATFLFPFQTSTCQLNLHDRESVISYVESHRLVRTNKETRARLLKLSDEDFFETLKLACALNKWNLPHHDEARTYKLFSDLFGGSSQKCLETLFTLLREKPMPAVWASVLTFCNRVDTLDEQNDLSEFYRTLLTRSRKMLTNWRSKVLPLLFLPKVHDINLVAAITSLRD